MSSDDLAQEQGQLQKSSLESLRGANKAAQQSLTIANATSEELNRQTGQMHKMNQACDDIDANVKKSKWVMRGMESFFGRVKNFFTKPPDDRRSSYPTQTHTSPQNHSKSTQPSSARNFIPGEDCPTGDLYGDRASSSQQSSRSQMRSTGLSAEQDAYLDEINSAMDQLKSVAENMNNELDVQGELLDDIHRKTDRNNENIGDLNRRAKKLLR